MTEDYSMRSALERAARAAIEANDNRLGPFEDWSIGIVAAIDGLEAALAESSVPVDATSATDEELWAELVRRGAALEVGYCYPAMCSADDATELVAEHGYEFGPFQLLERGHRLACPPQWPMVAQVPKKFRRRAALDTPPAKEA